MARLGENPLLYEPGTSWLYNTAADVLGVLIARVTEQPLETFLQVRVFTPLAMVDTRFAVPPKKTIGLRLLIRKQLPENLQCGIIHGTRAGPIFPSSHPGELASARWLTITSVSGREPPHVRRRMSTELLQKREISIRFWSSFSRRQSVQFHPSVKIPTFE